MTAFLVGAIVLALGGMNLALLVERHRSEAAHRAERERYVRALMSRTIPEFVAIERMAAAQVEQGGRARGGRGRLLVPENTSGVGQAHDDVPIMEGL